MFTFRLLIFFVFLVFILLFLMGVIGPKFWRAVVGRLNRWLYKDASPIFPVDPSKPIVPAIKEGLRDFWPKMPRRWRQLNRPLPHVWALILFLQFVILLAIMLAVMFY